MTDEPTLFDMVPDTTHAYGDTSGHAGSETSRERAEWSDGAGITSARDRGTLERLAVAGPDGLTWRELAEEAWLHHGEASGSLSRLHLVGAVARLTERRDRCQVYVLPGHIGERHLSDYTPVLTKRIVVGLLDEVEDRLRVNDTTEARRLIAVYRKRWSAGI